MADRTVADRTFDVVVIGAGPPGENAASYAVQRGLSAVVVEQQLVGGECSYWACMPSKAMLRPTEAVAAVRRIRGADTAVTGTVDVDAVLSWRDEVADGWNDDAQVSWLASAGIDLIRGHGRLAGERRVEVAGNDGTSISLEARRAVVIATGSSAAMPPIEGLADVGAWDNRDITEIRRIPAQLLVLGGGPVGVEMAQAIRRLGAEAVTLVEAEQRLLPQEESFAGTALAEALEADGVDVRLGTRAVGVARASESGKVTMTFDDGDEVVADELLVAVGRRARTDDLGLDTVGVAPGRGGFLEVDDRLRVGGRSWLYAIGDVNGRVLLTHHGKYQARLVGDAAAGIDVDLAWADRHAVVRTVFTDPQIAATGLTATQARQRGTPVEVVRYDLGATAGGSLRGVAGGMAQLVIDPDRDVIVGATMVGAEVSELIHAATVAVVGEIPIERLWHAIPAFPTMSEIWLRLLEEVRTSRLDR